MKRFSFFICLFLIVFLISPLKIPLFAETENFYRISISLDKQFYLLNEIAEITVFSNSSTIVSLNIYDPSYITVFSGNKETNESGYAIWNLPVSGSYGTYTFKANVTEYVSTCWATLLKIEDWSLATFPYNFTHKNINYTIKAKGFIAESSDSILNLSLPYFEWYSSLTINLFQNDMCLTERLYHASGLRIDITYARIYSGVKIIINGSIPEPQDFTFKFISPKTIKKHLDSLKIGHLIFDWSDMRKTAQVFSYNHETKELTVSIPQSFTIDPYIFEDGFESGDTSAWSGENQTPTIVEDPVHHGSYALECDNSGEEVYKEGISGYDTIYCRVYVQIDALPSNGDSVKFMLGWETEYSGSGSIIWQVYFQRSSGGDLRIRFRTSVPSDSSQYYYTDYSANTWYCFEVKFYSHNTNGEYRLWMDGEEILSRTNVDTSSVEFAAFAIGTQWDDYTVSAYFDCAVIDDEYIGVETEEQEENFFGSVNLNFSLNSEKSISFSLDGLVNPVFNINTLKSWFVDIHGFVYPIFTINKVLAWNFQLDALINQVFNINKVHSWVISLNSFINPVFQINNVRSWSFSLEGLTNINFGINSIVNIFANMLDLHGFVNMVFSMNNVRSWDFNLYGVTNLSFGISSIVNILSNVLNLYGVVNLLFNIASSTNIFIPYTINEAVAIGVLAFIIAIIALCIVAVKKS